jgi:predicted dehydrogenase
MISWASRSGPQWFLMPHILDMGAWIGGSDPVAATAFGHKGVLAARGADTLDAVQAVVEYDSWFATYESSWILPDTWPGLVDFEAAVVGDGGRASFTLTNGGVTVATASEYQFPFVAGMSDQAGQVTGFFMSPIRHFVDVVLGIEKPVMTGRDGLMVTATVAAIERSIAERRRVELAEVLEGGGGS